MKAICYILSYIAGAQIVLCTCAPVDAQPSNRHQQIGLLNYQPCNLSAYLQGHGEFGQFVSGLMELGYKPGESIELTCRSAENHYDRLGAATDELLQSSVNVIVTTSQPAGMSARKITGTVPIVTVISGDPVAAGLVKSLSRPGMNVTGVTYYATELAAKRLELLKQMLPTLRTVGILDNPAFSEVNPDLVPLPFADDAEKAARALGLATSVQTARQPEDLEAAIARIKSDGAEALFVLPDLMFAAEAKRIADLAFAAKLPTMSWGDWFTRAGCVMSYAAEYGQMIHRLAFYVDRILKGAKPGELPIEQPSRFRLSINLKTARGLGLEPPPGLMAMAEIIIE
jgi:putative ABC transport system substrate-binding protein